MLASALPFPRWIARRLAAETAGFFTPKQRRTLYAALAQMIPASGPDDWSAADVGAGDYIERLLSGTLEIYAGGPDRESFGSFPPLSRVKRIGWQREIERLRGLYVGGLAELDRRAGGDFAARPALVQELILQALDLSGSEFFAALYAHTMEGVYSHPVYGGNRDYRAWNSFCYQGDVHGVHFPGGHDPTADERPWDKYGGYSPEEMATPGGSCPGKGLLG